MGKDDKQNNKLTEGKVFTKTTRNLGPTAAARGDGPVLQQSDRDIVQRIGPVKMVRIFRKLYNKLCDGCKRKVLQNSRIEIGEYCDRCNKIIRQKLERFL